MSEAVSIVGEIVDNDAIEIGQLYQKAGHSLVDSVKYQIECGQRLTEKKMSMKHGQWLPWLEANVGVLGFSTALTAQRLMKVAKANTSSTTHLEAPEALQISRQAWGNSATRATAQTGDNEWFTPTEILDAARKVMGGIDLDPAYGIAERRGHQGKRSARAVGRGQHRYPGHAKASQNYDADRRSQPS